MIKNAPGDRFAEAMQAYESGRPEAARRLAKKLVGSHPDFGGAYYLLGLLALDCGQPQQACHHLGKAVDLSPFEPAPRLMLATALHRAGKPDQAAEQMRTVLKLYPDHAEAQARLGAYLMDMGEDEAAIVHFRQAVAAHPDWSAVLNNLGLASGRLGQKDQAVQALARAVEISPDHAGFRVNLAMALSKAGQLDAARAQAQQAAHDDPGNDEAWLALGTILQKSGEFEPAVEAFLHVPELASARWSCGEALRALGRFDEAVGHYQACLDLDPDDHHGARLGLALALGQTGPDRAPQAYVRRLFDEFAQDFDRCLVEGLEYRAPALIGQALERILGERRDLDILDLGCGTGLAAPVLRPFAKTLDGIDLSPAMIAKAAERGLYDRLKVGDIVGATGRYDVAVAADVLVYLGDLTPLMDMLAKVVRTDGWFVFTVERADGDCDWRLGLKSRYAHSQPYIARVLAAAGFTVEIADRVSTRSESGQPVPGLLVAARHG